MRALSRLVGAVALYALLAVFPITAQTTVPPFLPGEHVEIVRRHNYSIRIDGRYAGHRQRESRMTLRAASGELEANSDLDTDGAPESHVDRAAGSTAQAVRERAYRGEIMITENTIRDMRTVASRVARRQSVPLVASGERIIRSPGALNPVAVWQGVPTLRAGVGASWEAPAVVLVESAAGSIVALPVNVAYRVAGVEQYQGETVVRVEFGYTLVWPLSPLQLEEHPAAGLFVPEELPPGAARIRGRHQGALLVPVNGGAPLLHRTEVDELVELSGSREERSGFMLTWYRGAFAQTTLADRLAQTPIRDVRVERDELDRLRLSLRNLQFVANEATLLPGEADRIDAIAELLRSVPTAEILVAGHTADVGSVASQEALSVERARRIVDALVERGVAARQLRFEGRGGRDPVGDNSTAEGRAANRRVELIILGE